MNRIGMAALGLLLIAGFSSVARADPSLKQKGDRAKAEKSMADGKLKYMNEKCGSAVTVTMDWNSFDGNFDPSHTESSATAYCESALSAAGTICRDKGADVATSVKGQVKKVTCSFDKSADKPNLVLGKDGTLTVKYQWKTGNIDQLTQEWLMNNLH